MDHTDILKQVQSGYETILGENLTGIYVHGSIAFGCYDPRRSDIDFLVITKQAPSHEQKKQMIGLLMKLNEYCPPKGFEMSVVLEKYCRHFVHPTPYELHYSNAYIDEAQNDPDTYCRGMNGTDPDLAAHFTVTRSVGITLCGEEIQTLFAPVPPTAYLDSLRYDIENAAEEIGRNPVYIILNLCRVTAYSRHGLVLSKKQGGEWGLTHIPEAFHPLIASALDFYTVSGEYRCDEEMEQAFVKYMLDEIFA